MVFASLLLSIATFGFDDDDLPKTPAEVAHRLPNDEPSDEWLRQTLRVHPEFLDAEDNGQRLTSIAISYGKRDYLDIFINAGATIDAPIAVYTGDMKWLRKHLDDGGDIHERFGIEDGFVSGASSLLNIAARGGNVETISFLLSKGGLKFKEEMKNGGLLREAVESRSEEAVDLLIVAGAQDAMYAALWLAQDGKDLAMLNYLIAKKPELPNVVFPALPWNRNGGGPSWPAGTTLLMHAVQYHELNVVDLLISKGAKANAKDSRGWNALDYLYNNSAVSEDSKRVFKRLRAAGAEMSPATLLRFGTVAEVDNAIKDGRIPVNVPLKSNWIGGELPLEVAFGRQAVLALLMKRGADPWQANGNGFSIADGMVSGSLGSISTQAIIDGLDAKGLERLRAWRSPRSGWTVLHNPAKSGDVLTLRILLKAGIDKSIRDNDGKTAADLACNEVVRGMLK